MAAPLKRTPEWQQSAKSPWASFPLVAICSALVAGCVFLGSPDLWAASEPAAPEEAVVQTPETLEPSAETSEEGMELIASYQAISQSTNENRVENIRLAAEAIDGIVIEPGETFSFNDIVGDTEHDERYLMAPIISDDQTIDGRGGGICQVSTALYIAALKADLDVVERHAHTLVSDYSPVGLDATLAYGLLDLKLQNNSTYPMKIEARALGQSVEVAIYGHALSDHTSVDATSKVIDRYVVEPDDGELPAGTYYVAESYRVYYEDGVKTQSVLLSTDTYKVGESESVSLGEGSVDPTK